MFECKCGERTWSDKGRPAPAQTSTDVRPLFEQAPIGTAGGCWRFRSMRQPAQAHVRKTYGPSIPPDGWGRLLPREWP